MAIVHNSHVTIRNRTIGWTGSMLEVMDVLLDACEAPLLREVDEVARERHPTGGHVGVIAAS